VAKLLKNYPPAKK
jgi:hypothetical protein